MKELLITRRQALGGLVAAPFVSLTGCGNGDAGAAATLTLVPGSAVPAGPAPAAAANAAAQVNPMFTYYEYSGYSADQPKNIEVLPYTPSDVTTTSDRFNQGGLCYEFDGSASSVMVESFSGFPTGDFAVLLWAQSAQSAPAQLLQIVAPGGAPALAIGVGQQGQLDLSGTAAAPIGAAGFPSITDGSWHHIAVQKYGTVLQVFFDGIAYQSPLSVSGLPANSTVLIGGGWTGAIDEVRLYNRAFPATTMPQAVYRWTQTKADTGGLTGDIAAYFQLNGNAQNALGLGVEGVPLNVTPTTDRNGSVGGAYLFNGVNSTVTLNQGFNSTDGDFAIAFWEQSTASGAMCAVSATTGGVYGSSLDFLFNAGGAGLQIAVGGVAVPGLSFGSSGALSDGNWHWIFLQRAGGTLQLYVDGALAASVQNSAYFFGSTSVMQFGAGSGATPAVSNFWNGALNGVQIYPSQSFTEQQIAVLMQLQFLGRDGVGALSFNGKLWLLGGWNEAYVPQTCSEVWCSVDGVNWTWVTTAPWERRHDAGWVVYENKMWVVGGDRNTGNYENDVWSSADGLNWELVTDSVPWANRATQYVLAFNDRLWLMGGQQIFESGVPPAPVLAYNDVWSSTDGANWELVTGAAGWSPRGMMMGSAVFQGKMWVIGGGLYDIRTFNDDVWSSPDGVNWTQVLAETEAPWAPRQFQNIAAFGNKLWVMAGGDEQSQGGNNDVWYSPDGVKWTQLAATPWIARHAASSVVYDNFLWFTCGSDEFGNSDVWKLGYAP
jgi:hypothetical protein